jgi:hypothetical protein
MSDGRVLAYADADERARADSYFSQPILEFGHLGSSQEML